LRAALAKCATKAAGVVRSWRYETVPRLLVAVSIEQPVEVDRELPAADEPSTGHQHEARELGRHLVQ
jgi:hypothetical protein